MLHESIYYFDDDERIVPKEVATKFIKRSEDDQGNLIFESWGEMNVVQKTDPTQESSHFDTVENADVKRKMKKKKVTDTDVVDIIINHVEKR
jgi:hypothetical protein